MGGIKMALASKVLSIEVGQATTKVVEMDYKSKSPKIYNMFTVETPADVVQDGVVSRSEEFIVAIKGELRRRKIKTTSVVFTVSSGRIANREARIPLCKPKQIMAIVTANAFDYLSEESRKGLKYDVIILDPPAFTKTRSAVESALRGYKEINLRAMKMLEPGGVLVTCSCSQHVHPDIFRNMVSGAAKDAHVLLRQIEFRTQGKDHPILPSSPETEYLKCGIYQVFPV